MFMNATRGGFRDFLRNFERLSGDKMMIPTSKNDD